MTLPSFSKIVLVVEENHGYSEIIGSAANAPYINSLVPAAALFTDSHGGPDVLHPSFPNYIQLFSGSPQGLTDDSCPPPGQPFSAANLASAVIAAGGTFGGYAEDYPSSRTSCSNTTTAKTYAGRHVPWVWFTNVPSNDCLDFNTAWPATSAGFAALPDVSMVIPNLAHDMHTYGGLTSGSPQLIVNGDAWLKTHIDPYLQWAKSNNSLLILQWDEDQGTTADNIPTLFCGANINPGSYSESISHYNVLATLCALTGAAPMAGAASASVITDVWQAGGSSGSVPGTPTGLTVTAVTADSISLAWTAPAKGPVTGYDVWASGTKVASPSGTSYTVTGLTAGTTYSLAVDAFNGNGTGNQTPAVQAITSTGGPIPPVVQVTQGSTAGKTLTLTFTSKVQSYHGVVIALAGYANGSVSSITLGGVAGQFTSIRSSGATSPVAEIWACESISQAAMFSATVVITTTTAGIAAWAYEVESPQQAAGQVNGVYGLQNVTTDKTAGKTSAGTSWSSGATGTTVPGPEFVVGIGAVQTSGAVTGPASGGWGNQPAITDVAGAVTFGGVAGYQVQAAGSAAAYTYSGTSGSGTGGAVTATFLLMPCGEVGWSGYIWEPEQAPPGGYTGITATWTIPSYAATPAGGSCSIWVGLGNAFPQIGVYCTFSASDPGNNSLALWSFYEPGGVFWDAATFPVAVGDSLTCTITVDDTYFYMTMANGTQDWSYTDQKSIQSLMPNSTNLAMPKSVAEIIIEDEGGAAGKLPNYGTVAFTGISVTPTPLGAPVPWAFVNETITQLPGPYSGDSFTMTWESQT